MTNGRIVPQKLDILEAGAREQITCKKGPGPQVRITNAVDMQLATADHPVAPYGVSGPDVNKGSVVVRIPIVP